ncbi:threonine synthase [Paenibacillus flagellatus]|uniref:Threonine synthase n=1 Tax=Paenibacillus flagellatus TaxID=2211139 RepID=A0A2V5K0F3_9BACL|nr:threonine synthase [Paenibacillus flagellatus]PYI52659.1 threonine synthase [Paenibacillus flagellatus]
MKFVCIDCSRSYPVSDKAHYRCRCGGLLDTVHDFRSADPERWKRLFDERLSERNSPLSGGVWRYKELIHPELPAEAIVTKYEGNTGLYRGSETLRHYAGVRGLLLKAQSENPSGSFKDNGMTVAVSHGAALGYRRFACTSTGNTSSSMAMYAAVAEAESVVLLPARSVSRSKALQTEAYGATLIRTEGGYDEGIRFLDRYAEELDWYVCNSINPLRIEGQKSIVFELAHQLGWTLPDWVVVPGGALSNASALGKGLLELHRLGLIKRVPRIAVVQAEGASPFHRMLAADARTLTPEPRPGTVASALNIGHPPNWAKALRFAIDGANGVTASVSDADILEAKRLIDRSGIGCEPASAAALAGLRRLVAAGTIHPDETAVCILTGHLLKDADAIELALGRRSRPSTKTEVDEEGDGAPVPLTVEAIRTRIGTPGQAKP